MSLCVHCVCVHVLLTSTDGCVPLTMLVDECQCCHLFIFVCLLLFETLSLLLNLVNKESKLSLC